MLPLLFAAEQANSRLFALPPELRNTIYALALAFESNQAARTELKHAHARAPEAHLLLACRRLYNEAAAIYKDLAITYWTGTTFTLDISAVQGALNIPPQLANLIDAKYLVRITHIELCATIRGKRVLLHLRACGLEQFAWDLEVEDTSSGLDLVGFKAKLDRYRMGIAGDVLWKSMKGIWGYRLGDGDKVVPAFGLADAKWKRKELAMIVKACFETW